MKKGMTIDRKNWDQLLPHVLFAVREVPQASTGFSPFRLLNGRRPRGISDLAKEVLVLVPTAECKFLAQWQGPYEVVEQVGEVNYRVRQPGRRKPTQLYHVNIRKQWRGGVDPPDPAPLALVARSGIPVVPVGKDLSPAQKQDLDDIVMQHRDVFSEFPG